MAQNTQTLLFDSHIHIYPFHNALNSFKAALNNMSAIFPSGKYLACITERYDCNLYDELETGGLSEVRDFFKVEPTASTTVQKLIDSDGRELHIIAGQQIVTSENIEILALNMRGRVTEGASASATVKSILQNNGIPVVAWAVGKWFGNRGKIVTSLLDEFTPQQIALGDTSLRPIGWSTPFIMRAAEKRGFRVLAGSDPLPFGGEECRPGSYFSKIVCPHDYSIEQSLQSLLSNPDIHVGPGTNRLGVHTVAERMIKHKLAG
jgi:hypothetical protein